MRMVEVRILPPQPIFHSNTNVMKGGSPFRRWQSRGDPGLPAAVHGFDVGVAHLLKVLCSQRGAEPAATIEDEVGAGIRHRLLDVALNDAFSEVNRAGNVPVGPLVVLADVYNNKLFSRIHPVLDVVYV